MGHAAHPAPATRPALEVAHILREGAEAYRETHRLSSQQQRVVNALVSCRTAALGGSCPHVPQGSRRSAGLVHKSTGPVRRSSLVEHCGSRLISLGAVGAACGPGALVRGLGSIALHVELQDHRVVDDPVDRGGGGHRVLEDLVPLGEHQVGGDRDAAPLVAFGEQGEQHLHLAAVVLYVADVVE